VSPLRFTDDRYQPPSGYQSTARHRCQLRIEILKLRIEILKLRIEILKLRIEILKQLDPGASLRAGIKISRDVSERRRPVQRF
jgi:hypothetical protein